MSRLAYPNAQNAGVSYFESTDVLAMMPCYMPSPCWQMSLTDAAARILTEMGEAVTPVNVRRVINADPEQMVLLFETRSHAFIDPEYPRGEAQSLSYAFDRLYPHTWGH